jgi:hypothetical protein
MDESSLDLALPGFSYGESRPSVAVVLLRREEQLVIVGMVRAAR